MLLPNIFREYDIRGIADVELPSEGVKLLGQAFGTYLMRHNSPNVNLARDCRLSSDRLHDALLEGLRTAGCNVTDLGVVPTPLLYKGVVFLVRSGGIATSLDARTGKVLKQARLMGALEDYYSSPIGVDGKVYIASEHGKVVVLSATGEWEILAINHFDSDIFATPAVSGRHLYIRTQDAVYAIGTSK